MFDSSDSAFFRSRKKRKCIAQCITIKITTDNKKIKKEIAKRNSLKYYYDNINKLNKKYHCICTGKYTYKNKNAHENSKIHKDYILNNNNMEIHHERYMNQLLDSDYE